MWADVNSSLFIRRALLLWCDNRIYRHKRVISSKTRRFGIKQKNKNSRFVPKTKILSLPTTTKMQQPPDMSWYVISRQTSTSLNPTEQLTHPKMLENTSTSRLREHSSGSEADVCVTGTRRTQRHQTQTSLQFRPTETGSQQICFVLKHRYEETRLYLTTRWTSQQTDLNEVQTLFLPE